MNVVDMKDILKKRWQRKQQGVKNVSQNHADIKQRVYLDLQNANEVTRLTALAVALMLETSERVGNPHSADNGHFGITTLQKQHIKVLGSKVVLKYVAKSGVLQEKTFNNATIARILSGLLKRRTPSVFELSNGVKITGQRVNAYLALFQVRSKDIRTYNANETLKTELSKKQTPKEAVIKTAAKIGNKPTTLKNHYILPKIAKKLK